MDEVRGSKATTAASLLLAGELGAGGALFMRRVNTVRFGEIEVEEDKIVHFEAGILSLIHI